MRHNLRADLQSTQMAFATGESQMQNVGADTDIRSAKQLDITDSITHCTQATYNRNVNLQEYRIAHGNFTFNNKVLYLNISQYSF